MLWERHVLLSLFVVQTLLLLNPTGKQRTMISLKVFVFVLVSSNFCLQASIKYCIIEVTDINEKFMTLHNVNIVGDLHFATLLSVTHVHDILFNSSFTLISFKNNGSILFIYRDPLISQMSE